MKVIFTLLILCSCSNLQLLAFIRSISRNCVCQEKRKSFLLDKLGDANGQHSAGGTQLHTVPVALALGYYFCTNAGQVVADSFDPSTFQPLCPASDGFYYLLKLLSATTIGAENVVQYGPLIAGALLRVRLEFCVIESFFYEAVIPFVQTNGLSWVLPVHETTETFIAGTVFALASNVILLGGTKLFALIAVLLDILVGLPLRILSKLLTLIPHPSAGKGHPTVVALRLVGAVVKGIRESIEKIDTFVGRYMTILTVCYILFKFAHYKLF